jgi:hypothetical protein
MSLESADPGRLEFWKARLADGSILESLKLFPAQAEQFFGPQAVERGNHLQLGIIVGAWQILKSPPGIFDSRVDHALRTELRKSLEAMPAAERFIAEEFLSTASHEKRVVELAKYIVKEATGVEPP